MPDPTAALDDFGRAYCRLTLEIDKHVEGYVDAYFGPPQIRSQVQAAPRREIAALQADLARLQSAIPTADPARHAYLTATLQAIDCTLRLQAGQTFDYLDEVGLLYDITPALVDEANFADARRELDALLPGPGSITERLQSRRQRYELTPEAALPLLELAREATRQRTAAFVNLVDGESVEIALTQNQPWSAYNWYLGDGRSRIEFNTDIPLFALGLLGLFAHEGYPGHHTELQLKEQQLYREKGYAEHASLLLHSPAAVIAEGIATTALEIIFPTDHPDGDAYDWTADILLPRAGLPPESAGQMRRLTVAARQLRGVSANAAILYHSGQLDEAQTVDYIQTYALLPPDRARKSFSFISHPLFRAYVFTYTEGYRLIEQAGGDKRPLFRRLLTSQILPSQLAPETAVD